MTALNEDEGVNVLDPSKDNLSLHSSNQTEENNAVTTRKMLTVLIICLMNLINFMVTSKFRIYKSY